MAKVKKRNTKIVATVGPASSSYGSLLGLVKAGVNVFRLNFSHGTHDQHQEVIDAITKINERFNLLIGILADLQGPKIRIGDLEADGFRISQGDILHFVNKPCMGTREQIYMSYDNFPQDVKEGEKIVLDDGKVVLEVLETNHKDNVKLVVVHGDHISSRKGVNLPDTVISLPSLTEKDRKDLDFILTQPIHWIALSFVRSADDVLELREKIDAAGHPAKVVSKIEKPQAIRSIDKIIKASDGIMVARGDLGVEVPMERLPSLQKIIISKCMQRGTPVIVATQLMDSMINNPSPTRAEILDVANAVLDGTDAVMLSAETAVGKHPIKVIEAMNKIIKEAEKNYDLTGKRTKASRKSSTYYSDVICINAGKTADDIGAKGIVGITISGYTAYKISSYRPQCKIFIFSNQHSTLCALNLVWGVRAYYYDKFTSTDETISDVNRILLNSKAVRKGDYLVNTGSMPLRRRFRTNFLKITLVD
ncbi:MAG: pyruvate kinase [Saprospiraceae bacterium]|nr:pyruvate kinase [Saprospiraceae bacterium]